jgi:hypothetical protein
LSADRVDFHRRPEVVERPPHLGAFGDKVVDDLEEPLDVGPRQTVTDGGRPTNLVVAVERTIQHVEQVYDESFHA